MPFLSGFSRYSTLPELSPDLIRLSANLRCKRTNHLHNQSRSFVLFVELESIDPVAILSLLDGYPGELRNFDHVWRVNEMQSNCSSVSQRRLEMLFTPGICGVGNININSSIYHSITKFRADPTSHGIIHRVFPSSSSWRSISQRPQGYIHLAGVRYFPDSVLDHPLKPMMHWPITVSNYLN